ncbi:MAG: serine/threonine-protein kinase [Thermoanaerobaculum sp.]
MPPVAPGNVPTREFPFRIVAKAGEGSMGTVFKAIEPSLEREVAIKVLRTDAWANFTGNELHEAYLRFVQEARSAAAIKHPGAVTVYRIGELGQTPYIVMEWLDGETLAQRLARQGTLPIPEAVDVALQVLDVLQAAHEVGVVHRDIKPSNLMLLKNGRVKVADFGIAQFRQAKLIETQIGVVLGTPFYAAPEQLRGESVDPRCDVYAVAVVLFEMLAGDKPFSGKTFEEFVARALSEPPRPLRSLRPEVPLELEAVVMRGLAREREKRWPSARAMASALRAANVPAPEGADPFALDPLEAGSTIRVARQATYPVVHTVRGGVANAVCQFVRSWPSRELGEQAVEPLLAKLLDSPLHAPPFSDGVDFGGTLVLIREGAAVATFAGDGRGTAPSLPHRASARLYTLPPEFPPAVVEHLAALARGLEKRHLELDVPILDPPALEHHFREHHFTGGLALHAGSDRVVALYVGGQPVLALALGTWEGVPVESTWPRWVQGAGVRVETLALEAPPLALTYTLRWRGVEVSCRREQTSTGTLSASSPTTRRLQRLATRAAGGGAQVFIEPKDPGSVNHQELLADPAVVFLRWLLERAPDAFTSGTLRTRWKYLAEWIPSIRTATLHHHPDLPAAHLDELFDVVTYDESGKLLHLVAIREHVDAREFSTILERAVAVKEKRLERGDVGALVVVAPAFSAPAIEAYLRAIESKSRGLARLQETLTGYAGFVRIGHNRGFHVLLVERKDNGFEPMLE